MFCPACGCELPDVAKFCPKCGLRISDAEEPVSGEQASPGYSNKAASPVPKRSKAPFILTGVLAVAVIVGGGYALSRHLGSSQAKEEEQSSNSSLSYASASSDEKNEYFYSTKAGGVCRGDSDSGRVEILYPVDSSTRCVERVTCYDQMLYFAERSYTDDSLSPTVHAMKTDGTGDTVLYTLDADGDDFIDIDQIAVLDDRLYLVVTHNGNGSYLDVISMKLDGTDVQKLAHKSDITANEVLLTSEGLFYPENQDIFVGDDLQSSIVCAKLDGTGSKCIYQSDVGRIQELAITDGRICFNEQAGLEQYRIASINLDGSDYRVLGEYEGDHQCVRLVAAANGRVFFQLIDTTLEENLYDWTLYDIACISIEGGDPKTIATGLDFYNPTFSSLGSTLLILENGQYPGSAGERVAAIAQDGSQVTEYRLSE